MAYETAAYEDPPNAGFKNSYSDVDSSVAQPLSNREFG